MMPLRSHIAQLHRHLASKLLLDVQVVVFHVRSLDIPVKSESVALQAGAARGTVNRNSTCDRRSGSGRNDLVLAGANRVIGWYGIEVRRIRQVPHDHTLRKRIEEDAVAGTNHRFD